MSYFRTGKNGLLIDCYIQPGAGKDEIVGLHNHTVKIRISAPPVDGKANEKLKRYLAKQLKLPRSHISIVKGESGRHKTVLLEGVQILPDSLVFPY